MGSNEVAVCHVLNSLRPALEWITVNIDPALFGWTVEPSNPLARKQPIKCSCINIIIVVIGVHDTNKDCSPLCHNLDVEYRKNDGGQDIPINPPCDRKIRLLFWCDCGFCDRRYANPIDALRSHIAL